MAPAAPLSKYQPRKTSLRPFHPPYRSADIEQIPRILVTDSVHFLGSCGLVCGGGGWERGGGGGGRCVCVLYSPQ